MRQTYQLRTYSTHLSTTDTWSAKRDGYHFVSGLLEDWWLRTPRTILHPNSREIDSERG